MAGIYCFCRMFIWRSLLKLPENHAAYSSLVDKGTHTAFARLHEEYPIKSRKLLRVLQRFVLTGNNLHKSHTLQTKAVPNFRERLQSKQNMQACVKISSRQKVKHFPQPALLQDLSLPFIPQVLFFFFKLAPPKQHSFTLIPLALKATLSSMYHLRRELRFTSTCAYMYVARFTIPGKKRVIPLFVVPVHFECTQQQAVYCSVICYKYQND